MCSPVGRRLRKVNAVKPCVRLEEDAAALGHVGDILKDAINALPTKGCMPAKACNQIKSSLKLAVAVLPKAQQSIQDSAQVLSPIGGGTDWIVKKKARERKRKQLEEGKFAPGKENDPPTQLQLYNKRNDSVEPPPRKMPRAGRTLPTGNDVALSHQQKLQKFADSFKPKNGHQFTATEAFAALDLGAEKGLKPSGIIIIWKQKNLLLETRETVLRKYRRHCKGEQVGFGGTASDGTARGNRDLVDTQLFLDACKNYLESHHQAFGQKDCRIVLQNLLADENGQLGSPSEPSVSCYFELAASKLPVRLTKAMVQVKSTARYIAENSIMSATTFAITHAFSAFIVESPIDPPVPSNQKPPSIDTATRGAQKLYKLVREANGGANIYPIKPGMLYSIDNSTVYAFKD